MWWAKGVRFDLNNRSGRQGGQSDVALWPRGQVFFQRHLRVSSVVPCPFLQSEVLSPHFRPLEYEQNRDLANTMYRLVAGS